MEVDEREENLLMRFANDGEKIAEAKLEEFFKPFSTRGWRRNRTWPEYNEKDYRIRTGGAYFNS